MPQPTILLFDIDGTLLTTGGAGKRAIGRALERAATALDIRFRPSSLGFSFAGMTDRAIVRRALEASGAPVTEAFISELLDMYVIALREEVRSSGEGAFRVLPGVVALLDRLGETDAALGLGTGNVEEGARIKLEHVSLSERFSFGGFGSDFEERPKVVLAGARRGAQVLGLPLESCRVVVIGDTRHDVAAAHAIGAECVAVATGGESLEGLVALGPRHAFPNLESPGVLEALLGA